MEASEARKLTEENRVKIESIFDLIKSSAKNGMNNTILYGVSNEVIHELMKCGYSVSIHKDELTKAEYINITW